MVMHLMTILQTFFTTVLTAAESGVTGVRTESLVLPRSQFSLSAEPRRLLLSTTLLLEDEWLNCLLRNNCSGNLLLPWMGCGATRSGRFNCCPTSLCDGSDVRADPKLRSDVVVVSTSSASKELFFLSRDTETRRKIANYLGSLVGRFLDLGRTAE